MEACAGAGKTWMLVSRILRALIDGAEPQEVLAITFTRKAAGEMQARLQEWLASGYAGQELCRLAERHPQFDLVFAAAHSHGEWFNPEPAVLAVVEFAKGYTSAVPAARGAADAGCGVASSQPRRLSSSRSARSLSGSLSRIAASTLLSR